MCRWRRESATGQPKPGLKLVRRGPCTGCCRTRWSLAARRRPRTTPESARKSFPYYHEYLRPKIPGARGFVVSQSQFEAGTQRGNAIMIGSSEQLIEKILDAHEVLGLDRFLGQIDWGGLPLSGQYN